MSQLGVDEAASRLPHLQRVERLNRLWQVAGPEPTGGSLSHRLLFNVRRMIAAALRPQETFNAAVVEYINATAIVGAAVIAMLVFPLGAGALLPHQSDEVKTPEA